MSWISRREAPGMVTLQDMRLGAVELDEDNCCDTELEVGGARIDVSIDLDDERVERERSRGSVDLIGHDPEALVRAALAAVSSGEHDVVDEYLEHHLGEFDAGELEALLGHGVAPTAAGLRGLLRPLSINVGWDDDGGTTTVDVGFGHGVSNYVLAVRVDASGAVTEVDLES